MSVMIEILFNPFAGPSFNLVAIGVYLTLASLAICAFLEHGKG